MPENQHVRESPPRLYQFSSWNFEQIAKDFGNPPHVREVRHLTGIDLRCHVLIADDDPSNRLVLSRLMDRSNIVVTTAEDGAEAVKVVQTVPVDMVFLDINMPVMNGLAAARMIRKGNPSLPLVAVTSDISAGRLAAMSAAGFDACMEKPVRRNDLIQVVLAALSCPAHT